MTLPRMEITHERFASVKVRAEKMKLQLQTFAGNDGKVDETEFNLLVQTMQTKVNGKITAMQVKKMVIEEMENSGLNKVKTGFFSNWYTKAKKEVGLA